MPTVASPERIRAVIHRNPDHDRIDAVVVAILAAYPSVRAGLASMLHGDAHLRPVSVPLESLLHPESTTSALPLATDIVLVDPTDIPLDALQTLRGITAEDDLPILWIGSPSADMVTKGCNAVAPDIDAYTLAVAVRAAAAGLHVIDRALELPDTGDTVNAEIGGGLLSPREQEVLQLVANGMPNKAIARELGISDHTVKFHVSSLLTKLDAASRTEAVTIATRRGLLFV
jgi:DNA-binding NarL/FixJ family response regulator